MTTGAAHDSGRPTPADTSAGPAAPAAAPDGPPPATWADPLAAALAFAARGWHVFPLRPGRKTPAFPGHDEHTCLRPDGTRADARCTRAGRHVKWEERATTDPDRIRRAWRSGPRYGVGIACGPSGLLVVDLDTPKSPGDVPPEQWRQPGIVDGADVFAALAAEHDDTACLWGTHAVSSPHGGRHLYFAHSPGGPELGNTSRHLGWCIDTRGHGGFVAAPATLLRPPALETHRIPTGDRPGGWRPGVPTGAYAVDTDPDVAVLPLPGWVADRLTAPKRDQREAAAAHTAASAQPSASGSVAPAASGWGPLASPARVSGRDQVRRRGSYATALLRGELDTVLAAAHGTRNSTLNDVAFRLGRRGVATGLLPETLVADALQRAGEHTGLPASEVTATIRSGLRAGITTGHTDGPGQPPRPDGPTGGR